MHDEAKAGQAPPASTTDPADQSGGKSWVDALLKWAQLATVVVGAVLSVLSFNATRDAESTEELRDRRAGADSCRAGYTDRSSKRPGANPGVLISVANRCVDAAGAARHAQPANEK